MKSCHYGSSCGHKQGKSVLSYPPGKHANLKTDFTAQLCGKTRLDATHFVQPPSCPKPTSTPTFPHHNNEKSKKMPHFLSFNPDQAPLVWMAPEGAEGQAATPGTPVGSQATTLQNKNRRPRRICGFIVREGGVEPPLHHWNTDLNRARLPIPPLARTQKE